MMKEINNEREYQAIMERIDELVEVVNDDMSAYDKNMVELNFLTDLVLTYEKKHFPVEKPSLASVLKLRMYEMNLTQKSLAKLIGISPSRISEIISGKSEPTLNVARDISLKLKIEPSIVLGIGR